MNFNITRAVVAIVAMTFCLALNAKIYTWDKFGIAFEAPEGGYVPYSFFQDPSSASVEWDDMVMTLQRYIKNENTNKKNLNERLKSRAMGYNMYDTKLLEFKVKGFKCYSLEGTMPDGTRCIISYFVSNKVSHTCSSFTCKYNTIFTGNTDSCGTFKCVFISHINTPRIIM